ncbi:MAG: porin [Myxococcota bacterium]
MGTSSWPSLAPGRGRAPRAWTQLLLAVAVGLAFTVGASGSADAKVVYEDGDRSLSVGLWVQGWYQYVEDARDGDGDGAAKQDLHDFLFRRAYLSLKGTVTPWLGFFAHFAGDRFGQSGLDRPGVGLGSGLAFRDGWVTIRLLGDALQIQGGRMYVPFTRNYGTTSTKALLTTDLDWIQGGYRGGIFYPSTVGRDDGVTLWGNVADGLLQYRVMVGDGMDDATRNPDDNPRLAGRLSLSFFEPETGWFNQGSYLGARRVLSIGGGADYQRLAFETGDEDYLSWTVDAHLDQPLAGGGLTVIGSYVHIQNAPNPINFTAIEPGVDADVVSFRAGYILPGDLGPGRLQPFGRYEWIHVDDGDHATHVAGVGLNYFFAGHANKLSVEATWVGQKDGEARNDELRDHLLVTAQIAAGL